MLRVPLVQKVLLIFVQTLPDFFFVLSYESFSVGWIVSVMGPIVLLGLYSSALIPLWVKAFENIAVIDLAKNHALSWWVRSTMPHSTLTIYSQQLQGSNRDMQHWKYLRLLCNKVSSGKTIPYFVREPFHV